MSAVPKSLRGKVFGNLTPLLPTYYRATGSVVWHCVCDCGAHAFVSARELTRGNTKSCGCYDLLTARKHNLRKVKQRELPRGVYKTKEGTFKAVISKDNKLEYLGTWDTAEEASAAYQQAALEADTR